MRGAVRVGQLSIGLVCAAGGAGYLWNHRARSQDLTAVSGIGAWEMARPAGFEPATVSEVPASLRTPVETPPRSPGRQGMVLNPGYDPHRQT